MKSDSKIFNPEAKVLHHLDRVLKYFEDNTVDPISLEIDPSNACNHSCPFCISGHIHLSKYKGTEFFNRQMMSKEFLMKLVKDLSKTDIKAISFTGGGEPTMNPHLKEAIKYLKANSNIDLGMFSNGTMLKRFNLFETITDCLTWIRISMDAGNEKSYDNLRITNKNNNFATVLENVKELIKIKKQRKSNLTIGVGFVVSQDNYKEVLEFAELFKEIEVDYCQYKPEIIQIERNTSADKKEQIAPKFWADTVINLLNQASKILGNKFQCNSYKVEDLIVDNSKTYGREYKQCIGSQFQPCIGADGELYVCTNHRGHKNYSYGSLHEKSFSEIWSDVSKRKCIMSTIENKENFSNCSQLCKPHESNKVIWKIKNNLDNPKVIEELKVKSKENQEKVLHKSFI